MAQKASKSWSPRGRFGHKQVQQWQRSGATQVQYYQEHKLSVAAFRWLRRKLGNNLPARGSRERSHSASIPTFTEIRIPQGFEAAAAYAYEIVLPNGAHLRLCRNFDVQAVSSLVSLLGGHADLGACGSDLRLPPPRTCGEALTDWSPRPGR